MAEPAKNARMRFPSTHWTQVALAGADRAPGQQEALSLLLKRYYPALLVHLTAVRRLRRDHAEDLLQEFLASKVLAKDLLARAERRRGKFRTFLLTSLDRFVVSQARKANAGKRAPEVLVSLDGEEPDVPAPASGVQASDVAWVRQVIKEALKRTRAYCFASGQARVWEVFENRVLKPALGMGGPLPYAELVARLNIASPTGAHNLLVSAKRIYARQIEDVVGEYADTPAQVKEEIRDLFAILAHAEAG